jgi:LemA protein
MKMNRTWIIIGLVIVLAIVAYSWVTKTLNRFVVLDEQVKAAWAQVQNQYQRRFDLIPNLVETVKGYAVHEKTTLEEVTQARAKLGGTIILSPEMCKDPQLLQTFQRAQSSLGGVLQRLMAVTENYPELKADQNFLKLQDQLEGTENRIAVERRRYNETVLEYHVAVRRFPARLLAGGFKPAVQFKAEETAQKAPTVKF